MNKDYTYFDADDFLQDKFFLAWMRSKDPEANTFWKQWQRDHPDKIQIISEARKRYYLLTSFSPVKSLSGEQEEVWQKIERQIAEQSRYNRKKASRSMALKWSTAAAITLLLAGGWFVCKQVLLSEKDLVVVQAGNIKKKVMLADSSLVVLKAHAILKYHLDNCRELWLNGEAFFDVKHRRAYPNASDPFTIHAGMADIAVLGTAFMVKAVQDAARVVLLRGKVKASVGSKVIYMNPGEKVEWEDGNFSTEQVNPQLYLAWKDGEFHFEHTSLEELTELLKDIYGYNLVVKNRSALHTTSISGTVSAKDKGTLWNALSLLFNAKVEKKGKQIILTAN
ncbi:MAG TPA: FecR domain-containing protein [Chitinophagaceae bacterium]|nr:FecR domain-containing protein [Chitinophagaceae bacterium]